MVRLYFLVASVLILAYKASATVCPEYHPYAYQNGKYCCKYSREKNQGGWIYNRKCDGSAIRYDSECCNRDAWVVCPSPPCQLRPIQAYDTKMLDDGNNNDSDEDYVNELLDCSKLPHSMTLGFEPGCTGARSKYGKPHKYYCSGADGRFPWWEHCCVWKNSKCVPKIAASDTKMLDDGKNSDSDDAYLFPLHTNTEAYAIDNLCPVGHRYAYKNGKFCCKYSHEKKQGGWFTNKKCDGSWIQIDSECCKDDAWVVCPSPPCKKRPSAFVGYPEHCTTHPCEDAPLAPLDSKDAPVAAKEDSPVPVEENLVEYSPADSPEDSPEAPKVNEKEEISQGDGTETLANSNNSDNSIDDIDEASNVDEEIRVNG